MEKVINCTPHDVHIYDKEGNLVKTYPTSGVCPRLTVATETVGMFDGVPVTKSVYGEVENLPPEEEGTLLIVSALVATAVKRGDLVIPNEAVRDEAGRIIGCKSLGRV